MKRLLTILFIYAGLPLSGKAQAKFEREYQINVQAVPAKAINFINSAFGSARIKWLAEESHDGKTLEAKTAVSNFKYSVEFDTDGNILDVEKMVLLKDLALDVKNNICRQLDSIFTKHKVIKTQVQWKASNTALQQLIKSGQTKQNYSEAYELVMKGKKGRSSNYYEVLFTDKGLIKKVLVIERRSSVNLEF